MHICLHFYVFSCVWLGVTPWGLELFLKNYDHTFTANVFVWLFCTIKILKLVSYCQNTHILTKFGQNLSIWPPGWPYRGLPPGVWLLFLNNYDHTLHLMYFCGYFVQLKYSNWWVNVKTAIFWLNLARIWVFDPRGDHIEGYPLGFSNYFWRFIITLYIKCVFVTILYD